MNTINVQNIVSTQLSPVRALPINGVAGSEGRHFYLRDLVLVDDAGHRTTITIFAHTSAQQIEVQQ